MFDDAMTTIRNKTKDILRTKTGHSVLTGVIALSGLGAGLGAAIHHHAGTAGAGAAHRSGTAQATLTAKDTGKYFDPRAPREMYDSVNIPAIPKDKTVATYVNGSYAQPQAGTHTKNPVLWIDTNGSAPGKAQVLDVEPGDATPASAADWAKTRLEASPGAHTVIYTMTSQWDAARTALKAKLTPAQYKQVKWWIADPTGTRHDLKGADAVQWWWGGTGQNPAAIGQTKDINVDVSSVKESFWTK